MPAARRRVPVRTFADWNEPPPGSMEMDCVAHCGDANRGSYVNSLVLTDIASGWTEAAPMVVRESGLLVETLERVRLGLPFALRAPAGTSKSPTRGRVKIPHLTASGRGMITRFDAPWQGVRRIP
jgi:hypothetical protein